MEKPVKTGQTKRSYEGMSAKNRAKMPVKTGLLDVIQL
jgi:hypothetical protein